MTVFARDARASYAFVERNFNLTKRYIGWEAAFLVYAVAGALSVSLIGQSVGDRRLLMLLVVGAVFWNYLSVVFQSIGDTITWERWEGTLEYTMMAPIRRSVQLLGSALYAVIYGLIHTAVLLVSGVYYPTTVLPEWMQLISRISPATYVLDAVRRALIDGATIPQLLPDLWPLLITAVAFIPLGLCDRGAIDQRAADGVEDVGRRRDSRDQLHPFRQHGRGVVDPAHEQQTRLQHEDHL